MEQHIPCYGVEESLWGQRSWGAVMTLLVQTYRQHESLSIRQRGALPVGCQLVHRAWVFDGTTCTPLTERAVPTREFPLPIPAVRRGTHGLSAQLTTSALSVQVASLTG